MRVLSRYQTMHESRYFHNTMTHQSFIFTCRFVSHALIISTVRVQHKEYESRILTGFCFSSFLLWCCTSTATITPLALLWTGEEWDSLGNKSPDPPPCSQRSWAHVIPLSLSLSLLYSLIAPLLEKANNNNYLRCLISKQPRELTSWTICNSANDVFSPQQNISISVKFAAFKKLPKMFSLKH